jgi:peptide/nickel transport system substrate-binding protein
VNNIYRVTSLTLTLLLVFSVLVSVVSAQQTGPATDTIIFKRVPLELAAQAVKTGEIDYYIFGLRPAQAEELRGIPEIDMYYAPAGIVDFGLNPAPAPEGQLNPFSIREVRFALNYLINRDYVVSTIYKGFASPMYAFLSSYDPDYVTIYDIIARYEFKYDPALADTIITQALTKAGAVKEAGKWYYKGKPITIKFIIRIEDERREIGDALASELEKIGFTVDRLYMPFGQAIGIVYATDPKELKWHIYTEGWGKGAPEKYDYTTINQFGAPWYGYMPGYQEAGWWQYENSTIDNLGKRIFKGEFKNKNERDELYRKCSEMIIQEAVRIWVATRLDINPARRDVKGLTLDLGTGLRSPLNPREVYISGKTTVTIGHLWVWTERTVWNPIGGHDDVYSVDIWRAIYDPAVWRHPFSGLPIPFRADYAVETKGPDGTLTVPEDAFIWDAKSKSWVAVGKGVTAKSRVVFDLSKYLGSKWHHGQSITWADILFSIYQIWDMTYDPDKSALESTVAATFGEVLPTFKGFRIVGNSIEVYVDYWHFDANYIADYALASFSTSASTGAVAAMPWEVLAAMDKVVFEKKQAAYSDTAADKFKVPWLSLVLKDHAVMVVNTISEMKAKAFFPENVFTVLGRSYASKDEALARYDASLQWFSSYGNMVISNGPFYLYRFDPAAQYAELRAFRDSTYPFSAGKWYFGKPEQVEIVSVGIPTVVPGGESIFVVELKGPSPLGLKYLIKDPVTGGIIKIGDGERVAPTRFTIVLPAEFTAKLRAGLYELTIAGYSEAVSFVSAEKHFFDVLNIKPIEMGFERIGKGIEDKIGGLSGQINVLSGQLNTLAASLDTSTSQLTAAISSLNNLLTVVIILLVINLVVLIAIAVMARRK